MLDKILKYFLQSIAFWCILLGTGALTLRYLDFLMGYFEGEWEHIWFAFTVTGMTLWAGISAIIEYKNESK